MDCSQSIIPNLCFLGAHTPLCSGLTHDCVQGSLLVRLWLLYFTEGANHSWWDVMQEPYPLYHLSSPLILNYGFISFIYH